VNTHLHYVISFCTSSCKMAKEKKLDEEFGRIISDIKPHTKGLPYKSGKPILKNAHRSSTPSNHLT
jgi:hypothetical protein